jgi:hypothetical protein
MTIAASDIAVLAPSGASLAAIAASTVGPRGFTQFASHYTMHNSPAMQRLHGPDVTSDARGPRQMHDQMGQYLNGSACPGMGGHMMGFRRHRSVIR